MKGVLNLLELKGKVSNAKVFVDDLDQGAEHQIVSLLNEEFTRDSRVRIMPDVHVGAGSPIGTTMTITDKVVPNLVGVDIGCGLIVVELEDRRIDFNKLDHYVKELIPSGFKIRKRTHKNIEKIRLDELKCKNHVDVDRGYKSLGSLGGGNHFIELNEDDDKNKYLVIHSGSRNIGLQTAQYYQKLAYNNLKKQGIQVDRDLAYLEGDAMDDYLHDMKIIQEFAYMNRETMADVIIEAMDFTVKKKFQTIHNYIDMERMILRKGAVSAEQGETFILPLNMRDGSMILEGKGNKDWNYSAPHGAGRVMSRRQARKRVNLDEFKRTMRHIYSSSVSSRTLDEAPLAYKRPDDVLKHLDDTARVLKTLKPLYNFKDG